MSRPVRHVYAAVILLIGLTAIPALARLPYGRPDRAGNPPLMNTCGTGPGNCHSPDVGLCDANPAGMVEILPDGGAWPECYACGQTYNFKVKVTDNGPTKKRWGFEVGAQYEDGVNNDKRAGVIDNNGGPTRKVTSDDGMRDFIVHDSGSPAGDGTYENQVGGAEWKFKWTAPACNETNTSMCFYASGVAADADGGRGGDCVYLATRCLDPCPVRNVKKSWGKMKREYKP